MTSEMITEKVDVKDFHRVFFRCLGELELIQGDEETLTITAHEKIMPRISCEVRSGTLNIDLERKWFQIDDFDIYTRRVKFELKLRTLDELKFSGAGKVSCEELQAETLKLTLNGAGNMNLAHLQADEIDVRLSGAGQIRLAGAVADQQVKVTGAGEYKAPDLESESASATVSGAGGIVVRASDVLDAAITGLGSISYHGSPIVKKRITGLGSVNKAR